MSEYREVSRIEETHDGLVIHLAENSRLVRLGPSIVVIAEPLQENGKPTLTSMMQAGTTISCVCGSVNEGSEKCQVQITTHGPSTVSIKCVKDGCSEACTRFTTDTEGWRVLRVEAAFRV
jgi:hypothetical protein